MGKKLACGKVLEIDSDPSLKTVGVLQRFINQTNSKDIPETERSIELVCVLVTVLGTFDGIKIMSVPELFPELVDQVSELIRYSDIDLIKEILPANFLS